MILIDGEAGIGKSRLVAHALRSVGGGRASRIVTVECVPETNAELSPIRAALSAVWIAPTRDATALALRTVAQLCPDAAGSEIAARYTGVTLGKAELFAGIALALDAASTQRGTILILEDIHWADAVTLEYLAFLAPQLEAMRLMIFATCRSETFERNDALADVISRLLRARSVRHLELHPLARIEVADLIDGALEGSQGLPGNVVAAIIERCEGNPFFAEELLKSAVDHSGSNDLGSLPLSIKAGIRHRLAALAPENRAMLDVAAVLGVHFGHAAIAELSALPVSDVLRMLRDAHAAHIVEEVDASTFRFRHALTRQTVYDGLLAAERRALHLRILTMLETGDAADHTIEALAYHAWAAGDETAAARYSERAGERALERGFFSDARSYFERLLSIATDAGLRARLYEHLGSVATAQGDFAAARSALDEALTLREQHGDLDDAARIAVALAVERTNSGDDAIPGLETFLERHPTLTARARNRVFVFLARLMTALERFDRASELLSGVAPDTLEPRVQANYFTCRLNMSEYVGDRAAWHAAASEMLALAPGLPPLMCSIQLTNVAQTGSWFGESPIVNGALAEAQTIAQYWGFEGIFIFTRAVEAQLAFLRGDLFAARAALDSVARRPDVAPARVLAAQIGPFVATALNDAVLGARYENDAVFAREQEGESIGSLYGTVALLAHGTRTKNRDTLRRLVAKLPALPPGAFVPPTVALVCARLLDEDDLAAFANAARMAAAVSGNAATLATSHLIEAFAAGRSGLSVNVASARATRAFRQLGWGFFEALARNLTLGALSDSPSTVTRLLTARESEIADLIAAGQTNANIAKRLHIGVKTVEKHVSHVLLKLNARSRAQIATYITSAAARVSPKL